MKKWASLLVLALAFGTARGQELNVGDQAPALAVKEFVKGDPVQNLQKGKIHVVEFWATWCGPCITSIPHLTDLQKKNKDVVFIGVSVFESDQAKVKPFVEGQGEKMAYRVAIDDVPEKGKRNEGKMAQTWMEAAGQQGIPTAFIINADGKVAWIGHPMSMDKPLDEIVRGTWDLQAAAGKFKAEMVSRRRMMALNSQLAEAQQGGNPKRVLEILDKAIKEDPNLETMVGMRKFSTLAGKDGDIDQAVQYGNRLVEVVFKDNRNQLNMLAWSLVDPDAAKPDPKLVKLALQAALRADVLAEQKDAAIADTLAKAYFDNGDTTKAIETQERALKLAEGTPLEKDPSLKARLEQFRLARDKK